MAAEASKLLKGVDAVALHLAKTALTTDASVSEAPNVGKSYTSVGNSDINTRIEAINNFRKFFGWCSRSVESPIGWC